jgi:transposase
VDGVGSARELERRCREHAPYPWLCGGVNLNYHTLSDFRTGHEKALDALFTNLLAMMPHKGLVHLERISQDGMRIRASAGASSLRLRAPPGRQSGRSGVAHANGQSRGSGGVQVAGCDP